MSSFGPQSMAVEQRCGSSGDGRCGVDDFDCGAGLVCDDLGQKRIMGAAEDDAVGARFYQRRDGPVYELSDGGRVFLASFDRFHEPLAYGRQYPDAGGVFAAQFAEPVASQRSACGEHPDDAAAGGSRGRLDGRLHPDEGNGIGCPQPFDGYHRGRIAGQYDKFGSCAEQRAHGIVDIAGHLFGGLFAVGAVCPSP